MSEQRKPAPGLGIIMIGIQKAAGHIDLVLDSLVWTLKQYIAYYYNS